MSFNRRSLRSLLIAAALFTCAAPALAQDPKGPPPSIVDSPVFKDLGLSDKQKQEIQASQNSFAPTFEQKAQAVRDARTKLDQGMDADQDESKLRDLFKNYQQAHDEMAKAGFEQSLAIRKILTPAQRKKMREIRQKQADAGSKRP
ncbi:MAG TPA: periplasmic heavy metal sensor [bacterium]|nr:periplasmic heavy metal sensor [bacterium]